MSTSEANLIIEIWQTIRDVVPAAKRGEVAHGIMVAAQEYGFEPHEISDVADEDKYLAQAFADVFDIDMEETEVEDEE